MKKIIFTSLSGIPNDFTGGPNKVIHQIISKLDKNKFDAYFISKNAFQRINKFVVNKSNFIGIKSLITQKLFLKNKLYRRIFTTTPYIKYFYKSSINIISNYIKENNWDILHAHDVRPLLSVSEKIGKIILTIHSKGSIVNDMKQLYGEKQSLDELYQTFKLNELKALEKADLITFPSKAARDLFFSDIGTDIHYEKTKIIYNGIDIERINSLEPSYKFLEEWKWLKNYKYRILTVGSHIRVKNIDKIMKVFQIISKISSNDAILVCVGAGPLKTELKSLSKTLEIDKNTLFIDFLPNEEIIYFMKLCNIYISLSERVVFDLVILEALACGMNVIASDEGGNREVIDNTNGFLVDANDLEEIAKIIINTNLDINQNAINSAEKFSLENMIKNYCLLYEE